MKIAMLKIVKIFVSARKLRVFLNKIKKLKIYLKIKYKKGHILMKRYSHTYKKLLLKTS